MKITDANYKNPKRNPAVVCDFDDTTVLENVAETILLEFGGEGWREFQNRNALGLISLKEYQERAFSTVKVGRETMKAVVQERATLRPHFKSLYHYCATNRIPLVIASMGLDFYIEAVLEREGMESIPYYAVDTEFTPAGINYGYRYKSKDCWQPGNCKCVTLKHLRQKGHTILFAGDGRSDICPAMKSDSVFARRYLEQHFYSNGLPYSKLDDFSPLLTTLKENSKND